MAQLTEVQSEDVASAWIAGLASSRSGRLLSNHLACVELDSSRKGQVCAITEALGNERVFVHALARSLLHAQPLPCGLRQPLPLFIAILNLSGERLLAYSDNPSLLRCMCTNSTRLRNSELSEFISMFEAFPMTARSSETTRFVLLTYSLAWQEGVGSAFWHLSACEAKASFEGTGKELADRLFHFSSVSDKPFKGKSVRDVSDLNIAINSSNTTVLPVVSDKQISDFSESYSSVSLDFGVTSVASRETKQDWETARLHDLVQVLKNERTRDQQELRKMKEVSVKLQTAMLGIANECDEKEKGVLAKHKHELDAHRLTSKDMLLISRQQNDALTAEIAVMRETSKNMSNTHHKLIKTHEKLEEKHKELRRQGEAKDALNNAALSKHVATISRLECIVSTSEKRLASTKSDLGKAHITVVNKLEKEHEATMNKVTCALESKKRIINQLSENNDRKDIENASMQTHVCEQTKRLKDMEVEINKRRDVDASASASASADADAASASALALASISTSASVARKVRSKGTNTDGRNASTTTHHCASTQTTPPPKPSLSSPSTCPDPPTPTPVSLTVPGIGAGISHHSTTGVHIANNDIGLVTSMPPSYQTAIDMLQGLVSFSEQSSFHPPSVAHTVGCRPLPFPHFTPIEAYQPFHTFHPHHQRHPRHPRHPRHLPT